MGDGTKGNPYTREDVLKLIEQNGGRAEHLNLSKKWFVRRIALNELDLKGIVLEGAHLEEVRLIGANIESAFLEQAHLEGANLSGAHLEHANLVGTHLEQAELFGVHLEGAELFDAHLDEANLIDAFLDRTRLNGAHFNGVRMRSAKFTANTNMHSIDWGDYILGEEKEWEKKKKETYLLRDAEDIYRRLKQWYSNAGMYDIAGKFFYREMEAKRKAQSWKKEFKSKLWSWVLKLLCGYGEKWERVIFSSAAVILLFTIIYFGFNSVWEWYAFWRSLYFSLVSFTTSAWVDEKVIVVQDDLMRGLGVAESFIGVFMMALFLVTFTRKMTR
ncbi:MAG: pentapeptide repeat-containing protein [Dehalococcoidales bacterium]|nr:pentapeptide repeat-containing protein [Dehalococcoidales bacterium]